MSKNLAFSLLRGQWAIQPDAAQRWFPVIAAWLKTGNFTGLNQPLAPSSSIVSFYNDNGQHIASSQNGAVDIKPGTVAVIENIGEMVKYGGLCTYGADEIAAELSGALAHKNIIGVVLRTDSPGGQVSSIAPLVAALKSSKKPVVVLADTCASAAYYVAAQSDFIMAENNISAAFGSIGVVASFEDFTEYYEKQGIKFHTVYAEQSTHKNKGFHDAQKGDYDALKTGYLNPLAQTFINHVTAKRGSKLNTKVDGILAGQMFSAQDALKHGLIDGIGSLPDAIQKVHQLSTAKNFLINV